MKYFWAILFLGLGLALYGQQVNLTPGQLKQTTFIGPQDGVIAETGMVSGARSTRFINTSNLLESLAAETNWSAHSGSGVPFIANNSGQGTNTTFYLTGSGFLNIYSTNGYLLAAISNQTIYLNTNVVINGGLTINGTNTLDSIINLLVSGWVTFQGPMTNSTFGAGVLISDAFGNITSVTGAVLPLGINSGDVPAWSAASRTWLPAPRGEAYGSGYSSNTAPITIATVSIPTNYSAKVRGDFVAASVASTASWFLECTFRNSGGVISLIQSNLIASATGPATTNWNALYGISGSTNVLIQAVGDPDGVNWVWEGFCKLTPNSPNAFLLLQGGGFVLLQGGGKIIL